MNPPVMIDHGIFVRIVRGAVIEESRHQGRFSSHAMAGKDYRVSAPSNDTGMDKKIGTREHGNYKVKFRSKLLKGTISELPPQDFVAVLNTVEAVLWPFLNEKCRIHFIRGDSA
jgi:hypothetical protein